MVLYTEEEEDPTAKTKTLAVSRCPEHGHYSTVYDDDIIAYKHYALPEIRGVLDGTDTYSLACSKTRYNWKRWYGGVWKAVVDKIWRHIHGGLSKAAISELLWAHCLTLGGGWLRYVLDLFYANPEDLCTYILLVRSMMAIGGEEAHEGRVLHGVPGPVEGQKPP